MRSDRRRALGVIGAILIMDCALAACSPEAQVLLPVRETVLRPGETVSCTNNYGTIKISYVSETARRFEFAGRTVVNNLTPRGERWYGKLGLYDPAAGSIFSDPEYRLLVEEAQKNFKTYNEAYMDLYMQSDYFDWVYTNDGLACGYHIEEPKEPGQFPVYSVALYQFSIQGQKPTGLLSDRSGNVRLETGPS